MNRAPVILIAACFLAGCGGSGDAGDSAEGNATFAAGSEEGNRTNPSDMTPIDAALGFDGGMPAESAMPAPPPITDRSDSAAERTDSVDEVAPAAPVVPPPVTNTVSNATAG